MPRRWTKIPISSQLFTNVDDTTQTRTLTAVENAFVTEAGGHSRFPGLKDFVDLPGNDPVYIRRFKNDLIATTSKGRVYRVGQGGDYTDVTNVPLSGGQRPTFAETDDGLLMAAGGPILRFVGNETKLLSPDAPETTHVDYIDSYVVALEKGSGRFFHSDAGAIDTWNPLNVFSADGKPDDISALIVTPFRELLLIGRNSIEQFERLSSGDTPFFRRWSTGEGVYAPYTLTIADNATWSINQDKEHTRYSGQTQAVESGDVQLSFDAVDDWRDAWSQPVRIAGQRFIILQMPYASNGYGGKGLTFLKDMRSQKWATLFGWNTERSEPDRWPGWSIEDRLWGKVLVGGDGKILEMDRTTYQNNGAVQRVLGRTGHIGEYEFRCDNVRMRVKRGVGDTTTTPEIMLRCNRDNKGFGRWKRKGLGKAGRRELVIDFGNFGCAHTMQFEWMVTDACDVQISALEWLTTPIGE